MNINQSVVGKCCWVLHLRHFHPQLFVVEQTPPVRENLRQREKDATMDGKGEAEHSRASAAISIHNQCKLIKIAYKRQSPHGCEGDLAATSVTPLIARVDSADLAGQAGVLFLPHRSM